MESANKIFVKALKLPDEERALLAEKLLQSLLSKKDTDPETEWKIELDKRIEDIDKGGVELINWDDIKKNF